MARKKGFRIPGLSFSWKRALGITAARQKIARATGIPTTREGRRRKFGPFGLFAVASLILGAAKAASSAQSQTNSTNGRDVSRGCLGCVVVGAVLTLCVFAACGGLLVLSAFTPRDKLSRSEPPTNSFRSQLPPIYDSEPVHSIRGTEDSPNLPAYLHADDCKKMPPPTLHLQSTPDSSAATKSEVADTTQLPWFQPDSHPKLDTPKPTRPVRKWTSADGQFTVEAEFISFGSGKIKLRRVDNGKELNLDEEIFSPADLAWIRSRF